MDEPNSRYCPHYQMHSEPLEMGEQTSYLAVRRCLLTERMIILLRQSSEGSELADKLMVNAANGRAFAFVGPDLEAVTQRSCTLKRCEERCTPSYLQHLQFFEITDPHEDEVTCDEREKETKSEAIARRDAVQDVPVSFSTYP